MAGALRSQAIVLELEQRLFLAAAPLADSYDGLHAVENTVYFVGADDATGAELWRTDGTRAGTGIVKDLRPGEMSSDPQRLVAARGKLFFVAAGKRGRGIWCARNDGTTVMLGRGDPDEAVAVGGDLYFTLRTSREGISALWRSDGTPAGTRKIRAAVPSTAELFGAEKTLYIVDTKEEFGQAPTYWIYASNGTPRGMKLVASGAALPAAERMTLTLGDRLLFLANAEGQKRLWSCDPAGARVIGPAPASPPAQIGKRFFCVVAGEAADELWVTNGTAAGTRKVGGLPRPAIMDNRGVINARPPILFASKDRLIAHYPYRWGDNEPYADELWRINAGTAQMQKIWTYDAGAGRDDDFDTSTVSGFYPISTGLVFNHAIEIRENIVMGFTSGTAAGTRDVPAKFGGVEFRNPLDVPGQFFFISQSGQEYGTLYVWNYSANKAPRRV